MTDSSQFPNRRVLIIDDNEAIHADIRKILSPGVVDTAMSDVESAIFGESSPIVAAGREHYHIDSAYKGEDGFEMVKKSVAGRLPYALAFVDMRMPVGWDGLETIQHIWHEDPDIQFVVCTAYTDHSWEDMVRTLGKTDRLLILKKPFETIEVQQVATALVEKWNLAQQARVQMEQLDHLVAERTCELQKANESLQNEIVIRLEAEQKLQRSALYDSLTDLPNRAQLLAKLEGCMERARRRPEFQFAVLFLDLDNFKVVNDSLGHDAGDDLLREAAARVVKCVRSFDGVWREDATTGRLGGDEFVVILEEIKNACDASRVAERIHHALSAPFSLNEHSATISVSIGIVVSNVLCQSPGELLRNADTAMYRAKNGGKSCHAIFNQEMHNEVLTRLELENDLRQGVANGEFHLEYQPIVAMGTGRVAGFEALLRWNRRGRELVPPDVFIPIAEETRIILDVGRWVMMDACRQLVEWKKQLPGDHEVFVSVNVSKHQLAVPTYHDEVAKIIRETGIDPGSLHLEITESAVIDDDDKVGRMLRKLKELGVRLYLDDFGTGYSSLSCLYAFPLDVLKIDRAFVYQAEARQEYAGVIGAVMTLARSLNMKVVAEGVETKAQLAQILAFDCDYAQGFYFSKPISAEAAWNVLESELIEPCLARREDLHVFAEAK